MNTISASYNFPAGFLWGISADDEIISSRDYYSFLYGLKENFIGAVTVNLKWADFEPLKNNYNEMMIESVRNLFARINNQNIEPVVILDIGNIPQWQNLEKNQRKGTFSEERYNFSVLIANAIIPYTKFLGLCLSEASMYSNKLLQSEINTHQNIRNFIHSVSEQVKVGTIIPNGVFGRKHNSFLNITKRPQIHGIQRAEIDFVGISADDQARNAVANTYKENRIPLMIISDNLRSDPPESRLDELTEKIYNVWRFYMKGWEIIGYISETDISSDSMEKTFFINTCRNNSFEISTDNPNLSEKWIRFLKD